MVCFASLGVGRFDAIRPVAPAGAGGGAAQQLRPVLAPVP